MPDKYGLFPAATPPQFQKNATALELSLVLLHVSYCRSGKLKLFLAFNNTARVRSMTGGYVSTGVCLLTIGGTPVLVSGSFPVSGPMSFWGTRYPSLQSHAPSGGGGGIPQSPVSCSFWRELPHSLVPFPSGGWGGLSPGLGTLPSQDWGIPPPPARTGVPLARKRVAPLVRTGTEVTPPPAPQTCYAAGGTPLVVSYRKTFWF